MSLVGNRWIEAADPGAVGSGYQWLRTTDGNLYERDTTNTSWTLVGNVNQANYGDLPLTGGTMSGAIAGVTGWAPLDSPNFTTVAKLLGVNLATVNDLASLSTALNALITSKVDSAIASSVSTISINNNIVVAMGIVAAGAAYNTVINIPAPIFSDGITATPSQCFSIASPNAYSTPGGGADSCSIVQTGTSLQWVANFHAFSGSQYPASINYLVIAIR